ncbi:MAG: chemotaxis protein CheA [Candidatus Hydrothermales bacterium]
MIDKKYIELFKSEAEEIINNLEKTILELEKKGWTQRLINEIFRYAHTLKGMAAAVERKDIEEFCHKLEDEFDELRKGKRKDLDFDFLFRALDSLKIMLKEEKKFTFEEIKSSKEIQKTERIYEIKIYLDPETQFLAARMLVILKTLKDKFEILSSEPLEEEMLKGEVENVLKVVIKTDEKDKYINEILESFTDIMHYFIEEKRESEIEEKEITIKPLEEIKVRSEKIDRLMDIVGELVIEKERLFSKLREQKDREFEDLIENLERIISHLQDEVMSIRLIPAIQILERFKRFVRDKAKEMGKEIEFIVEGGNIELDRVLLEEMREPLLHMIRNSIDHGIEPPEERIRQGKPSRGKIVIKLEREKNSVTIFVIDDGRGIDKKSVLRKAIERGIISEERAKVLTDKEILELIAIPGFTTREDTTKMSGRGIGLDIVKQFVTKMGGVFEIESKFTKGTTIKLKLPLSLAITKGVVVSVAEHKFVIPLIFVQEIIEGKYEDIKKMMGKDYMLVRDEVLPCIWMNKKLNLNGKKSERFSALLVESERKRALLLVDKVLTQMDVVVKPLDIYLMRIPYVSGGTILGDGTVAIIIDPSKFLES